MNTLRPEASSASPCPASTLSSSHRKHLALQALAKSEPIVTLAQRHGVSRKFIYQQASKAEEALTDAFNPSAAGEEEVLLHLPITRTWLRRYVLGSVLIGHSPLRGVVEMLRDLFDIPISLGTVHNVVAEAVQAARRVQENEDLTRVRIGAHDEIYQAGMPVLVGADVSSTYCYLLEWATQCDADTWALQLWDRQSKGLAPDSTIADGGVALRAGQQLAWPHIPCHADVFHAEMNLGRVASTLEDRAYVALRTVDHLRRQHDRQRRRHKRYLSCGVARKLHLAEKGAARGAQLAQDLAILARWMREDVLALVGPDFHTRCQLFDFILQELRHRIPHAPGLLADLCSTLENQRDKLLAFSQTLDYNLEQIANEFHLPVIRIRELLHTLHQPDTRSAKWPAIAQLRQKLGHLFHPLSEALRELLSRTVRASSIVENLNSRLRSYFFLRRHIGPDYLCLLRFFLNHRRFLRSEIPERQGKSPAELLTGQSHPHWLEMLGWPPSCRQAA